MSGWAPLRRMTIFHTGDSEWIALCWRSERENAAQAYGPFRNQTEATKWARETHPRCYVVGRVSTPGEFARVTQLSQLYDETDS